MCDKVDFEKKRWQMLLCYVELLTHWQADDRPMAYVGI